VKQQNEDNNYWNRHAEQPEQNRGHGEKSFLNGFVNTRSVRNRAIRIQEKLKLMKAMSSSLHPPTVFTGAAKQSIFPQSSH